MEEFISKFLELFMRSTDYFINGVLAAIGATAKYLYDNAKHGRTFSLIIFFTNTFLAFFVGNVVHEFLPADTDNIGGILMVTGFCTYPVVELIEQRAQNLIDKLRP